MFFSGKKCPSGKDDAPIYKKVKTYKEAFAIADDDEVDEIKAWYDKMKNYMDQQELVIQRPLLCCKCDTQIKKGKKMQTYCWKEKLTNGGLFDPETLCPKCSIENDEEEKKQEEIAPKKTEQQVKEDFDQIKKIKLSALSSQIGTTS